MKGGRRAVIASEEDADEGRGWENDGTEVGQAVGGVKVIGPV